MRRFYLALAEHLKNFIWGRALVYHVTRNRRFYENFEALYTALILALLIKSYVFEAYKIPSSSMLDTLQIRDRIFVNKFIYKYKDIQVGDIIVFKTEGLSIYQEDKPYYIKRVVGLPGDLIEVGQDGHLYRNGKLMDHPHFFLDNRYVAFSGVRSFKVPDGELYVFGDNSRNSSDSRRWGGVPLENVMGKAFFRYYPFQRIGLLKGVPPESVRLDTERERLTNSLRGTAEAAEPGSSH